MGANMLTVLRSHSSVLQLRPMDLGSGCQSSHVLGRPPWSNPVRLHDRGDGAAAAAAAGLAQRCQPRSPTATRFTPDTSVFRIAVAPGQQVSASITNVKASQPSVFAGSHSTSRYRPSLRTQDLLPYSITRIISRDGVKAVAIIGSHDQSAVPPLRSVSDLSWPVMHCPLTGGFGGPARLLRKQHADTCQYVPSKLLLRTCRQTWMTPLTFHFVRAGISTHVWDHINPLCCSVNIMKKCLWNSDPSTSQLGRCPGKVTVVRRVLDLWVVEHVVHWVEFSHSRLVKVDRICRKR